MKQLGEQVGTTAANSATGGVLGLLFGGITDRRQRRQQQKLQNMQIAGNKEMMDYSNKKQMEMWYNTSYGPQMEELKKAGLNPGLMYGMGGGGGQTTGSASGSVQGASAPVGGGEMEAMMQMGIQREMAKAQIEVMKSQANLNNTTANKQEGVDTKEAESRTDLNLQGLDNMKMDYEIKRLQQTMNTIENYEKQQTQNDRFDEIKYEARSAKQRLEILESENKMAKETVDHNIEIVRQKAIEAALQNALIGETTNLTKEKIQETKESAKAIYQSVLQKWDGIEQENTKNQIYQKLIDYGTDPTNNIMQTLMGTMGDIMKYIPIKGPNVIKGFEQKKKY